MKETIKNVVLLILVLFFAIFFGATKGNDELNLNFSLPTLEEEFSYPVYSSVYNGLYRNNASNGIYVLVGKNVDETYRVYFIEAIKSVKNIILQYDSLNVVEGKITFDDTTNANANSKLVLEFGNNELSVEPSQLGLTNEKLTGYFLKQKDIGTFSMSEFEY